MRGNASVVGAMAKIAPSDIAVSSITCYELYTGAEKCVNQVRERSKVDLFLSVVQRVVFDCAAASLAAQLRAELESRGEMIGPYDILIAGHAQSLGLTMVTGNTREFARVAGLVLVNWELATP
jgi:tRNA(fMet)-specific endonuclease VapC